METRKFLNVLQSRGLCDLFTQVKGGCYFHCHHLFSAWFSGCEQEIVVTGPVSNPEGLCKVFAPHGKVVTLSFRDWEVLVIVTPWGPLEIYTLWTGGGQENLQGQFTLPHGDKVGHDGLDISETEFILLWEKSYDNITFGDHHVDFYLRH